MTFISIRVMVTVDYEDGINKWPWGYTHHIVTMQESNKDDMLLRTTTQKNVSLHY